MARYIRLRYAGNAYSDAIATPYGYIIEIKMLRWLERVVKT